MKKRVVAFLLFFVVISIFVGFSYVNAEMAADGGILPIPDDTNIPIVAPWPEEPGAMPDLIGGRVPNRPRVYSAPSTDTVNEPASPSAPEIDAWFGTSQKFGQIGNPQQWVNILGNVTGIGGSGTLKYSLNGGPDNDLSVGSDSRRLTADGDFNIEIDYATLNPGNNTVVIKASDGVTDISKSVTVNYTVGKTWPSDYTANWGSSANIQDTAQVVDGYWQIDGNSVYIDPDNWGYDRLLAIGDETWTDYEITVPVTVFSLDPLGNEGASNGSALGMILRWQGNTNIAGEQPNLGVDRLGGIGWYRWSPIGTEGLELRGYDWSLETNYDKVMEFDTPYIFKMAVQSDPGNPAWYYLKFWKVGEKEPLQWDIQGYSGANASPAGSLLLVAHHVEAEFGQVTVKTITDLRLDVNIDIQGEGSVLLNPDLEDFGYSQRIFAYPMPDIGYEFDRWTGDYVGTANPADFRIYRDMDITAHFKPKPPTKLKVNVEGLGSVEKDPNRSEYPWGEEVSLTAVPADDQVFLRWIGDVTGSSNPASIIMDADKEVTAVFGPKSEATPKSDDFSQCELNSNIWTLVNPAGDARLEMTGTTAKFRIPAGSTHDMWSHNSDALRIMQPTDDLNFEVVAKFETLPTKKFQMEGILVQQDADNWLRFDFHHDGNSLRANAAKNVAGNAAPIKAINVNSAGETTVYIRVERNGNKWIQAYSFDGNDWTNFAVFLHDLEVNSSGLFVGNAAQSPGNEPAFTARADYFFNTAVPIDPEDEGNTVDIAIVGQGQAQKTPLKNTYKCGEKVTLSATPANEWIFAGWSGDFSSIVNPAVLTVSGDHKITANFSQGATVFLPSVMKK